MNDTPAVRDSIDLVPVAWFDNLPEAELTQSRLELAGVASALDNATLVGWFWQLSNAVGGITLSVASQEAGTAREILGGAGGEVCEPAARCAHCQTALEPGWDECWRCAGRTSDAAAAADEHQAKSLDHFEESWERLIAGSAVVVLGLCYYRFLGITGLATYFGCLALYRLFSWLSADSVAVPEESPDPDEGELVHLHRADLIERIAEKAWWSAMIGLIWFPPCALYALWLTRRLDRCRIPLTVWARRRRAAALWAVALTALCWFSLLALFWAGPLRPYEPSAESMPWPITR